MISLPYDDLRLDDAPREVVRVDAAANRMVIELDDEVDARWRVTFAGVKAVRYVPSVLVDRRRLFVGSSYVKSILVEAPSPWIAELHHAEDRDGEAPSQGLHHYIVPSDEGVWELLARACEASRAEQPRR